MDRICNRLVDSSHIDSVVSMKKKTILERLTAIEVSLTNHLAHHDRFTKFVMYPMLVGMILLLVKAYILR